MKEILIACGEVEVLRRIAADLPPHTYKPIATRTGAGIAGKLAGRELAAAIVHESLADQGATALCVQLRQLEQSPPILWLYEGSTPGAADFDRALKYPTAGPVFRNALANLSRQGENGEDLEQWRRFYQELQTRLKLSKTQDYFQIIGLSKDAPHHQLVQAYDLLSQRYHPDRYRQFRDKKWGKAIHEAATDLFMLMTEAYQVLNDRKLRALYTQQLEQMPGEKASTPSTQQTSQPGVNNRLRLNLSAQHTTKRAPRSLIDLGESTASRKFLRLAQSDLAGKNLHAALQNLKFAQSMEPANTAITAKITELQAQIAPTK